MTAAHGLSNWEAEVPQPYRPERDVSMRHRSGAHVAGFAVAGH